MRQALGHNDLSELRSPIVEHSCDGWLLVCLEVMRASIACAIKLRRHCLTFPNKP